MNIFKIITKIILIVTFISCAQYSDKTKKSEIKEKKEYPDMTLVMYKHYIYKNGKINLEAKIGLANFFEKKNIIECENFEAKVYNSKNELTTIINSLQGTIDKDNKVILFKGNVKIQLLNEKATVYTEQLKLDYNNNILLSEKEILIKKEDGSYLKASSMSTDLKTEITTFQNMETKYYYEDEDKDDKKKKK